MFAKKSFNLIIILALLLQGTVAVAQNYRKFFNRHYLKAETSARALRPLLQQYARLCDEDSKQMEAVIFPELMRYNAVFDVVETGSLMGLYSRLGSDYANFSIGRFQMKPSFALAIEKFLIPYRDEAWVKALAFDQVGVNDNYEDRSARIDRLDNPEWQVKYLVAMFKCIRLKHADAIRSLSAGKKLAFLATAYNCGWDKSTATINSFATKCYYCISPWGSHNKYNFAKISLQRYNELIKPGKDV
jgi:hypothetical protein